MSGLSTLETRENPKERGGKIKELVNQNGDMTYINRLKTCFFSPILLRNISK